MMTERTPVQMTLRRTFLAIILVMALCGSASAALNVWSGTGPFAPVTGHRAVYALAISPDGSIIYSGLNSGTVFSLTFDRVPAVTHMAPPTGPATGGTTVTITGTHFTGVLGVKFGTIDATSYHVDSTTQITATAPSGPAGAVDVRVTTISGTSTATTADVFTYTGPAARLYVSGPATTTAGTPFTYTVTALDALGSTVTGYSGIVHFTSSDISATLPANAALTAGTGTFSATLNTAGTQTISANDTVTDSINGDTGPITVSPGPVTGFTVAAPGTATAGTSFSVGVTALDAQGNTNTSYGGTVHFTSTDGAAVLPANSHLTSGTGSFSTTLNTAGSQTITATDTVTSSITGTSGSITVGPGPAARFSVSAPATATAGSSFTFTVTALDADGNTNTGYSGTVDFTSSDGAATLPFPSALPSGTGTFSATLDTAGTQTITATDTVTSTITGASNTITVSPAAADHFTVTAPAAATAGTPLTFTVTARDPYGNRDTGYAGTVHFSGSDGAATLPANSVLTAGTGTFSATLMTGGTQTITATDSVTSSITGTSGSILVSATTHFSVAAPVSATSGTPFTFTVNALDGSSNPVAGYPGTVHFTSSDPAATLPADATLTGGTGTFTATLRTTGSRTITAIDTGTVSITGTSGSITVSSTVPTTAPTTSPGSGSSASSSSGSNDDGYRGSASELPPMTVTVNIGGDSKAWQAVVTGTKLSELIVTGTVQHGPGDNRTAPPKTVFQYFTLIPARYTSITKAVINFTVPQSWLGDNHIAPGRIVLYHQTANGWEALPTTVLSTEDGTVYFSAVSPGFSLFAIVGTPDAAAPAVTTVATFGSTAREQTTTRAIAAKAPLTTQTTAPSTAPAAPAAGFPFMTVVLIVAGCVVLIGSGWYVRRWWIRRQNPALFREYD